ncbi:Altronate dehydratase (plasmid) [Bilophila wadsworthia]|uniref:UxaA family hydrolase n=1 Tax=Bilophila wadsworthia TaxID=35833 RepID=UPI00242E6B0F|nr:UxaA family hydrolase [Bilophila wadsworthia]
MLPEIMGYRRPDGRFGIRNHIAVIATMDNANPTVRRICSLVKGCVPFCPGFGRGEMNEDLALHNLLSINTALHPNVYGVIVVALEDQTAEYITGEIAKGGKPVVGFSIEDQGGTVEVAYRAAQAAIQMLHDAGRLRPEPMPWSEFVLGVECGGSDGSSGIVSNPVTGRLADRVIDAGGTVIMSETLELLGGEEMLGRRAVTPEVAAKVKGIIQRTLDYAAEHNLDIMGANPAPDNIAGGLTTIEEKALGAIKKGGTRPLVEVLEEGERPTKKGFVIMDAPAPGVENLTAIVSGGCHAVIFSTGKGNCIGHPVAPVIKISGNPMTVKSMRDNIDVDVSGVINQGLTLDQATDIVQDKLVDVCWGAMTSSDMLGEIETAASRLLRTL